MTHATRRPTFTVVALVLGTALVAIALLALWPRSVSGTATLGVCHWGWPVLTFEGADAEALPDDVLRQLPVASWPDGLRWDDAAEAVLDAGGATAFRPGDVVRVEGEIVEVHGDPSPCFYTRNVRVDAIAPG